LNQSALGRLLMWPAQWSTQFAAARHAAGGRVGIVREDLSGGEPNQIEPLPSTHGSSRSLGAGFTMGYVIREIDATYARDWLRLRDQLWPDEDHWPEIQQFFAGGLEEPNQVLLAFDPTNLAVAHVELSIRDDIEGLFIGPSHRSSRLV